MNSSWAIIESNQTECKFFSVCRGVETTPNVLDEFIDAVVHYPLNVIW